MLFHTSASGRIAALAAVLIVLASLPARASADDLMLASTPVFVGGDSFGARVAARSGGREPVGLVLSGGSARAFAHIGVLRRLEEDGVVPDFIVANSMGSIIGLLYAAGLSPDQIYGLVSGTELGALFEPTLPVSGGVLDPRRFSDLIRLYLGDLRLEDLPIPIVVICEDLRTKREIRLAEGDLVTILEAAYALPVFFPPVELDDYLLIDGGVTNLVPLGAAREFSDTVIVSSTFYDNPRLNLRNPIIVLNTSIDIGKRRAGVADLLEYPDATWIRCSVESFSFMSFDRLAELDAEGYRSADAMSDRLAGIASGGVDEALAAVRLERGAAIAEAARAWAPFERAPAARPALSVAPTVRSSAYPGDPYLYLDSAFVGAGLGLRWGALEASIDAGGDWRAYGDGSFVPAASVSASVDPLPWLRLETLFLADWDRLSERDDEGELISGAAIPALYQRSALRAAIVRGGSRLELSSAIEADGLASDGSAWLLTSGARYGAARPADRGGALRELSAGLGHQLAVDRGEHLAWADAEAALSPFEASGALRPLTARLGAMARVALSAGAAAPFYLSDAVFVPAPAVLDGVGPAVYGASLSLGWEPPTASASFAELVIARKLSLAAFADAAWAGGPAGLAVPALPAALTVGLRAGCDFSLIGLKSSSLSLEAGYDLAGGSFAARLFLSPAGLD